MNQRFTQKTALLFLLVIASGILLSSFHYHEGGKIFNDCPICRFQDLGTIASNVEILSHNLFLLSKHNEELQENEIVFISHLITPSTLPNAPPAFN